MKKDLKSLYKEFKKAKGYSDGGDVEESALDSVQKNVNKDFNFKTRDPQPESREDKYARIRRENSERMSGQRDDYQSFAEGGEVTPEYHPYDDSQDAMVQKYKAMGLLNGPSVATPGAALVEGQIPQGQEALTPPSPASLESLENQENADDKELEEKIANEDFEAGEKSEPSKDEEKDDESADDSKDSSREVAAEKVNPEQAIAPAEDSSPLQSLLARTQGNQPNQLSEAQHQRDMLLAGQQIDRGAALMGAGMAKTSPDANLKVIGENDKAVNLPVEKYNEQIANQKNDPNSDFTKNYADVVGKMMGIDPLKFQGMSQAQMDTIIPFAVKKAALETAMQKTLKGIQSREGIADKNLKSRQEEGEKNRKNHLEASKMLADARKDMGSKADARQDQRLSGQIVQRIHMDPVIKPSEQNMASLAKSKSILENKSLPLTPQLLADAEQDIASALTIRGMGGTEGKIKRSELITLNRKIAEAKQKWLNQPGIDLRKEDPDLVGQIYKTNRALYDDYGTTIKDRKAMIAQEYQPMADNSPRIQKAVNQYLKKDTAAGAHQPGDIVMYQGKKYQVGSDGDSLNEVQ